MSKLLASSATRGPSYASLLAHTAGACSDSLVHVSIQSRRHSRQFVSIPHRLPVALKSGTGVLATSSVDLRFKRSSDVMTNTGRNSEVLLQMQGIDKSFPGVHALKDVSLELHRAEVLALVGENGAGKSTLIKVLGGAHLPDDGVILLDGQHVDMSTPTAAQQAGVSIIYQEFNLVPDLTVRENIFLGRERTKAGFVRMSEEHRDALKLFEKIGLQMDQKPVVGI